MYILLICVYNLIFKDTKIAYSERKRHENRIIQTRNILAVRGMSNKYEHIWHVKRVANWISFDNFSYVIWLFKFFIEQIKFWLFILSNYNALALHRASQAQIKFRNEILEMRIVSNTIKQLLFFVSMFQIQTCGKFKDKSVMTSFSPSSNVIGSCWIATSISTSNCKKWKMHSKSWQLIE